MTARNEPAQARDLAGLTQSEFSILFGVHPMTVSKWERGVLAPSPYQLALIRAFRARLTHADQNPVRSLLLSRGVIPALAWLLGNA